jgi:hypothetical protein
MEKVVTSSCLAAGALVLASLCLARSASATTIVTPGEQNTQSAENGCAAAPCSAGHWLHYPELLQAALGAGTTVYNNGDGGAVLGCGGTATSCMPKVSYCSSSILTTSIQDHPDIVIIGPFGEHDQRMVASSTTCISSLYNQSVFEAAYEGLIAMYPGARFYMMTPLHIPLNASALPAGDDLVENIMLPASLAVAQRHQIPVIDTYTAISGTQALVTQYYANDGQVNAAGQQAMASLIQQALSSAAGSGGAGGSGAGGASGSGGGPSVPSGDAGTTLLAACLLLVVGAVGATLAPRARRMSVRRPTR